MADEIKHEEARWTNPTNWGQGTAGAGVLALAALDGDDFLPLNMIRINKTDAEKFFAGF